MDNIDASESSRSAEQVTREYDIKFIYTRHKLEDSNNIWERVKDSDIILMESSFRSEIDKMLINHRLLSAAMIENPEAKQFILDSMFSPLNKPRVDGVIAKRALFAGKIFLMIDQPLTSPDAKLFEESFDSLESGIRAFYSGCPTLALRYYKDHIQKLGESSGRREISVAREVQDLQKDHNDAWKGKKIAIIQGTAHTATYHHYKRANPEAKTMKLMPESYFIFPDSVRLSRSVTFKPDREIPEVEFIRSFLVDFIITRESSTEMSPSSDEDLKRARNIHSSVSDSEIVSLWNELLAFDQSPPTGGEIPEETDKTRKAAFDRTLEKVSAYLKKKAEGSN